jgi:protein TonB
VLRLTWIGARASAIGLSGAVHAALFLTPLGHGGTARAGAPEPVLVDIEVEPAPIAPPVPADEPETPLENRATGATAMATHTHPYPVPATHDSTPHDPSLVHVMERVASQADTSSVVTSEAHDQTEVPRFTMTVSFGVPVSSGVPGAPTTIAPMGGASRGAMGAGDPQGAFSERAVDRPARLVRGETPSYPSEARAQGVEADVKLELVVSAAGTVDDVRIVRRAGHGLDEAAAVAARQFRFAPAEKDGHPVRVRMSWAVEFRLD